MNTFLSKSYYVLEEGVSGGLFDVWQLNLWDLDG